MIVLDTNVLSEPLRKQPDPRVIGWLKSPPEALILTSITVGEILVGVRLLPSGRRREGLMASIERVLTSFADRVLPYDDAAARVYAELQDARRIAGRPLSVEDGMIAAICRHRKVQLATRNQKDFQDLGVGLLNPWDGSG